jgi:hypothetical protein
MAFQVSPGINVSEIDLTTVVPAVSTTVGAIAGVFSWGPVEERVLVSSENSLIKIFGKPTANNFETFYSAANFLAYGNALYVARAADCGADVGDARNAQAKEGTATAIAIKNLADYQDGITAAANARYYARYVGALGNSLKVSVCDSAAAYSSVVDLTFTAADDVKYSTNYETSTTTAFATKQSTSKSTTTTFDTATTTSLNTTTTKSTTTTFDTTFDTNGTTTFSTIAVIPNQVVNSGTGSFTILTTSPNSGNVVVTSSDGDEAAIACVQDILDSIKEGDYLRITGTAQYLKVASKSAIATSNATTAYATITFESKYTGTANVTATGSQLTRYWEFYNVVDRAPGQSDYVAAYGNASAQDELHVVVVDEDGKFTGAKGAILEVYEGLSRATDAKGQNGKTLYYGDILTNDSEYIYLANDRAGSLSDVAEDVISSTNVLPLTLSFTDGVDSLSESNVTLATLADAYDLFKDKDTVDISLLIGGKADISAANYLIDNIVESRRDCVLFVSPTKQTTADAVVTYRNSLSSTSYAVLDSGYKYQYDRYNDVYRYIPLNGDVAGLCARTDVARDPWFSPAGFNRGQIKNVVKLAFNPNQADRDLLYKNGINPVVTFPGQGTVLFGDKTLLTKPSAFDRINVRRLFIILEKAIANAAKSALFEFNDEFTRAQFRNLVEPYLREIQGRQGITDFKVVCDKTNNTAEVIDRNEFVGDIYVKPARSINFIQLNFVAVRSGVEFNEIVQGA